MTPYNKFQYIVETLWNEEDVEMVSPESLKPGELACTFNFIDGKPEQQGAMFGVVESNIAGKIRFNPITGGVKAGDWVDFPAGMYGEFTVAPNDRFIRFKRSAGTKHT